MANIPLGQTITGAFTADDPKVSGYSIDQYDLTGLDDYRQLTIELTCTNTITPLLINLIDTTTGNVVAIKEAAVSGQGKISLSNTTVPGASYRLAVGGQSGSYTVSTVNGGKATSIVSTTEGQSGRSQGLVTAGTVGTSGKFFPLAASTLAFPLSDIALSASGQFYGIGRSAGSIPSNNLYRIDPRKSSSAQVSETGFGLETRVVDTQGNPLSGTIEAIEFVGEKLYALDRTATGNKLYTIDPSNRVATLVGDLPAEFVTSDDDFVYDAANNRFLATAVGTPTSDTLWQIPLAQPLGTRIANPAGATAIGSIGFTDLAAISFENGQLTGFKNGTSPTKININPNTGAGTLSQPISGLLNIAGATTIVGANVTNPTIAVEPIPPNFFPTSAVGAIGTKSQGLAQGRIIDLTDFANQALKADLTTKGDAAYTNNIGFYTVTDALTGAIDLGNGVTIKPGDVNYARAAVTSAIANALQLGKNDQKSNLDVPGGGVYAPIVIAQGSLADFARDNSSNSGDGSKIHAYFNYLGANPDQFEHFRLTSPNTFAVEDQYGGGDKDFNDLIVNVNARIA
jgi:Domain of unknown function (DUF4114)